MTAIIYAALLGAFVFAVEPQVKSFSDRELEMELKRSQAELKVESSTRRTIIYVWSPHMNLSKLGLQELAEYTKKQNINLIALVDPNATRAQVEQTLLKYGWPEKYGLPNESLALRKKGTQVHYPSYSFIANGKFVGSTVMGYKRPEVVSQLAKSYFP